MTGEVLAHGDDGSPDGGRPPRRFGSLAGGLAVLALLAVGVAAAIRSPDEKPDAAPTPSATPSGTPSASRSAGWTEYPAADPFETYVSAHRPAPGKPSPLLLPGNVPVFLADEGGSLVVYEAFGGPEWAPVLLSWCSKDGTLQDRSGRYRYLQGLPNGPGLPSLVTYPVREPGGSHVDIGVGQMRVPPTRQGEAQFPAGCPGGAGLVAPELPEAAENLYRTGFNYSRLKGRYVVSTERRVFCPLPEANCSTSGWEEFGPHTVLPPGDLAGSYTWEGEFLVRTDPAAGGVHVVLTDASRLVKREAVGTSARVGWAEGVTERGGVTYLRFNAFAYGTGGLPDDSPPGEPHVVQSGGRFADLRGGVREYAVRPGTQIYLGRGITGLGLDPGTPADLAAFLKQFADPYTAPALWLVMDREGNVIRVVADRVPEG